MRANRFKKPALVCIICLSVVQMSLSGFAQDYQWAKNIGGTSTDKSYSIATDISSNVLITGFFVNTADFDPGPDNATLTSAGNSDIFIAKYDSNGTYIWAISIGSSGTDQGYSIATDVSGNVLITGYFQDTVDFDPDPFGNSYINAAGGDDIFIAKYDANGNYRWAIGAGSSKDDYGNSITTDDLGSVLITGEFKDTINFNPNMGTPDLISEGNLDIFLAKYDSSGNHLWSKSIGSTVDDYSNDITTDSDNNVLISGSFRTNLDFDPGINTSTLTPSGSFDIFFAKYDSAGDYLWAKNIGGTSMDVGYGIAVDNVLGGILVTGYFFGTSDFDPGPGSADLSSEGMEDIFFAKYDSNGNFLWANSLGSASNDFGHSIISDNYGNVIVSGKSVV